MELPPIVPLGTEVAVGKVVATVIEDIRLIEKTNMVARVRQFARLPQATNDNRRPVPAE